MILDQWFSKSLDLSSTQFEIFHNTVIVVNKIFPEIFVIVSDRKKIENGEI